jgi:hypothetical protein
MTLLDQVTKQLATIELKGEKNKIKYALGFN